MRKQGSLEDRALDSQQAHLRSYALSSEWGILQVLPDFMITAPRERVIIVHFLHMRKSRPKESRDWLKFTQKKRVRT